MTEQRLRFHIGCGEVVGPDRPGEDKDRRQGRNLDAPVEARLLDLASEFGELAKEWLKLRPPSPGRSSGQSGHPVTESRKP